MKVRTGGSVWDTSPAHQKIKTHLVESTHWGGRGQNSTVRCDCGWSATGPTHEWIERAFWQHRRDLGLNATILTITTPLAKARG